jgi:hypothetical protein
MEIRSARTTTLALSLTLLVGESVPTPPNAPQARTDDLAAIQLAGPIPDSSMLPTALSTSPRQLLAQAHR